MDVGRLFYAPFETFNSRLEAPIKVIQGLNFESLFSSMLYKSRRYLHNMMDFDLPINFVCEVSVYFAWSVDNFISIKIINKMIFKMVSKLYLANDF